MNKEPSGFEDTNKGMKAVLDRALQSYEKYPMLQVVFDKIVRLLTIAMRNFTSESVEIRISKFTSLRYGNYLDTACNGPVVIYKALELEGYGIMTIDKDLIYLLVDLLLGGKKNQRKLNQQQKFFTYIEQEIIKQFSEVILHEFGASFEQVAPINFVFERLESSLNFVNIARTGDAIIVLQLEVEIDSKRGTIEIVFPYSTLEPIKDRLQQVFLSDGSANDEKWKEKLTSKMNTVSLHVDAIIGSSKSTKLANLANLKIGDTLMLDCSKDQHAALICRGVEIMSGVIGSVNANIAINIQEFKKKCI